jgi:hypothetical protein
MSGVITGGWGFVFAAYGITATVLGVYGVSLALRLRREGKKEQP